MPSINRIPNARRAGMLALAACMLATALQTPVSAQRERGPAAAAPSTDPDARCRANRLADCSRVGEELEFRLGTGQQAPNVGDVDPVWLRNGGLALRAQHPAWQRGQNLWPRWIGSTESEPAGLETYTANVWIPQDPYMYDALQLRLRLAADNAVTEVRVYGYLLPGSSQSGNRGFETANFITVNYLDNTVTPFRQGCNEISVTVRNDGSATGFGATGNITAVCSKCTSPRPEGTEGVVDG